MKDELRGNKVFGAILGTALVMMLLTVVSGMIFAPQPPKKPGYYIAVADTGAGGAAEVADVPPDWGTVLPTADVAAGATVSTKCQSCHNFTNGGPNQTGPNLWGVIGRPPGTHPGFAYSSAMQDFGKKLPVWDYAHIYQFLAGPQAYINGTKMSFVGLKKREDRINLIAWLRQQNSSPVPIPAPDPKAAAAAKAPAPAQGSAPAPTAAPVAAKDANKPAGSNLGGPVNTTSGQPSSGVGPTSGAAASPSAVIDAPGGKAGNGETDSKLRRSNAPAPAPIQPH